MIRFNHYHVISFHGYRTFHPWEHGFHKVLTLDSVNHWRDDEARKAAELELRTVADWLHGDADLQDIKNHRDNHYGFMLEDYDGRTQLYVHFSDGFMYVLFREKRDEVPR